MTKQLSAYCIHRCYIIRNRAIQWLTCLNPMRWYLEILRGIVLKNINMHVLWPAVAAQSILTIIFISAAASRFKKTLA